MFEHKPKTQWIGALAGAAAAFAAAGVLTIPGTAHAQLGSFSEMGYVGPAFLQMESIKGDAKEPEFRNWIRVAAHYWKLTPPAAETAGAAAKEGRRAASLLRYLRSAPLYTLPYAPDAGPGSLVIALDKGSPALAALMASCEAKAHIPRLDYSVSSERSRFGKLEGDPAEPVPEYLNFRLSEARIAECPVVEAAPEQAFVIEFQDIEWTNWHRPERELPVTLQPAALIAAPKPSGITKAWVLTWFAVAHDVSDDQCPVMHQRPPVEDFYAFMSEEEAAQERERLTPTGGPNYENGQMSYRGPNGLNVTMLPGIVPDPGLPEPQTRIARGLNLDGDNGRKHKHRNYVSADGKITGIDNQLYTVDGCIAGWQGHKGFILQFANNQMRDGAMSLLVEVSGIDDERNDDEVFVTWSYSLDPMVKSASGSEILHDYTFRRTGEPLYSHYFQRVPARIVDGVILADGIDDFSLTLGYTAMPPLLKLRQAAMRLEIKPDGSLTGVLGGYRDWREISSTYRGSASEFYHGFQQPALYNALKRNADGLKDPHTGEFAGISTAYDIEGAPAFVIGKTPAIAEKSCE